ncbi:hypothetical protein B4064_2318 [Caldibacillus thermoamylovorans]|nr:hypothetical protein B4064_2318 [Caldibacillus thermoamylovorans]
MSELTFAIGAFAPLLSVSHPFEFADIISALTGFPERLVLL